LITGFVSSPFSSDSLWFSLLLLSTLLPTFAHAVLAVVSVIFVAVEPRSLRQAIVSMREAKNSSDWEKFTREKGRTIGLHIATQVGLAVFVIALFLVYVPSLLFSSDVWDYLLAMLVSLSQWFIGLTW
jgi:hypothetical protein